MKTNLIKIGNSKGVRINSNIIKECEIGSEVELNVVDKKIIKLLTRPEKVIKIKVFKSQNYLLN